MPYSVKDVQAALNRNGFGPVAVDGLFGPNTKKAVKAFQKAKGLMVDGIVGKRTWAAMNGTVHTADAPSAKQPDPVAVHERGMFTASKIRSLFTRAHPSLVAAIVDNASKIEAAGINTKTRAAHFLANIGVETGGLRSIIESLNYSTTGLRKTFGSHRISAAECERLGRKGGRPADQEAIANAVYGGAWGKKNLGNTKEGDGWRFRGGGMIQTTGRYNYRKAGYEDNPEALRHPVTALDAALKFWEDNDLNSLADTDNEVIVRKKINGGTNGLALVRSYLSAAKKLL